MTLTKENYYSPDADLEYMSCSQYQSWLECEAATLAKLEGRYAGTTDSEAFLVGNYVHTYFEGKTAHEDFIDANFGKIFKTAVDKKTGETIVKGKYAPFEKADKMINTLVSDRLVQQFLKLHGENEKIMTGTMFGVPWRIRIDKYIPERNLIIDYKTCADFYKSEYSPVTRQREGFIETYGYMMRAAVYSEIEKQNSARTSIPQFILICVSKQDPPDKAVILLSDEERYEMELEHIKRNLLNILRIKNGSLKPRRCGKCEYCRATKQLKRIQPYWEYSPGFEGEPEEDER